MHKRKEDMETGRRLYIKTIKVVDRMSITIAIAIIRGKGENLLQPLKVKNNQKEEVLLEKGL